MISILKMCAVQYDKLKDFAVPPKILYTFVQNNDTNPTKLEEQVCGIRADVVKASDSDTIEATANTLLGRHPDLVRVLGTAYT